MSESSYTELVENRLDENPIAKVVGQQLMILCDRLAEISEAVNEAEGGEKKPTIGVVIKEAGESADEAVTGLLAKYNEAKDASKKAYRSLLISLHPEFADDTSDDEVDDSERAVLVTEAKDLFSKVKSGLAFIDSLDGFTGFSAEFLASVPVVDGARMRVNPSDSAGIRPRFSSIEVTRTDTGNVVHKGKTATDVAAFMKPHLKDDETLKGYASGDLIKGWVAAGGNAETPAGTAIAVTVGPFTVSTVKA